MAVYCRESLLQHMNNLYAYIFQMTEEALFFYEDYFGYPYPFSKYDSIFCPE